MSNSLVMPFKLHIESAGGQKIGCNAKIKKKISSKLYCLQLAKRTSNAIKRPFAR